MQEPDFKGQVPGKAPPQPMPKAHEEYSNVQTRHCFFAALRYGCS